MMLKFYLLVQQTIIRKAFFLSARAPWEKKVIVGFFDAIAVVISFWAACLAAFGKIPSAGGIVPYYLLVGSVCTIVCFKFFGLYRTVLRYTGTVDINMAIVASTLVGILNSVVFSSFQIFDYPNNFDLIFPALTVIMLILSRATAYRILSLAVAKSKFDRKRSRAFIYGAGSAGTKLLAGLGISSEYDIVAFIDDDSNLFGRTISGKPIYNPYDLRKLRAAHEVDVIILALPSVPLPQKNKIVMMLRKIGMIIKTIPALEDIVDGKAPLTKVSEVGVVDLLGREPVKPHMNLLRGTVDGKVVLVSGAGGSIGSELCRQILRCDPIEIVLIDNSEFALYSIKYELEQLVSKRVKISAVLGSVTDKNRMSDVFAEYSPHTVYHAAAFKHVPLLEENVCPAISNNVFGTMIIAHEALMSGVGHFMLVSTDKAVRPTSVMGATKRLAELVVQAMAANSDSTLFSMVRFGNVLGSSGSVLPRFLRQIESGGPITVTHPDMTRFFMTIPEASQLVLQSATMAKGGDVFLLDMGEPMKIIELARSLIELSGLRICDEFNPDGDIAINITGLRPGEKMYEELLIDAKALPTDHPRVFRAIEEHLDWHELRIKLLSLQSMVEKNDGSGSLKLLDLLVPRLRI